MRCRNTHAKANKLSSPNASTKKSALIVITPDMIVISTLFKRNFKKYYNVSPIKFRKNKGIQAINK